MIKRAVSCFDIMRHCKVELHILIRGLTQQQSLCTIFPHQSMERFRSTSRTGSIFSPVGSHTHCLCPSHQIISTVFFQVKGIVKYVGEKNFSSLKYFVYYLLAKLPYIFGMPYGVVMIKFSFNFVNSCVQLYLSEWKSWLLLCYF